ncbi:hypothetical protein AU476_24230 [Cupriavidus sp. UYMSc13B]|nr:hypothetical protein AU476_24230 [Cupriavidus sp. UYMSc13B]
MDLVEAYSQALHNDPATLAADEALSAGREKAVQGNALLRPRINLQAGVSRINNRSSADLRRRSPGSRRPIPMARCGRHRCSWCNRSTTRRRRDAAAIA